MGEQKDLPFPYEFKDLDPEEEKLVEANLGRKWFSIQNELI